MPFIEVKRDPNIEQSESSKEIVVALGRNTNPDQIGDYAYEKNMSDIDLTLVYGVQCPIIAINGIVVAYEDILRFELKDNAKTPSCTMLIRDRRDFLQKLATPQVDNEMVIQILPPFEDAYKKIDLVFFISSFKKMDEDKLLISGVYKLPKLTDSQYKTLGSISTYKLFDTVSSETGLGFATNVEDTDDKRFMYCNYNSYLDLLNQQMEGSEGKDKIYDWFVDCWNYLVLVDVKDRYDTVVPDKDNGLWISNLTSNNLSGTDIEPIAVVGTLTNLYGFEQSQLFIKSYKHNTNPGTSITGTDKVYSIYKESDKDYTDIYLGNEDVKKDKFEKYEYVGEVYGDYDYLTPQVENTSFYQKMAEEVVKVDLCQPLLGLYRGEKINIALYDNNSLLNNTLSQLKEEGAINENAKPEKELQLPDFNPDNEPDKFKLDEAISGQYLIIGNIYKFSQTEGWTHTCILSRPADKRISLLKVEEESNQTETPETPTQTQGEQNQTPTAQQMKKVEEKKKKKDDKWSPTIYKTQLGQYASSGVSDDMIMQMAYWEGGVDIFNGNPPAKRTHGYVDTNDGSSAFTGNYHHLTYGFGMLFNPISRHFMDETDPATNKWLGTRTTAKGTPVYSREQLINLYLHGLKKSTNLIKAFAKMNGITFTQNQIDALASGLHNGYGFLAGAHLNSAGNEISGTLLNSSYKYFHETYNKIMGLVANTKNPWNKKIYSAWYRYWDHKKGAPGLLKRKHGEINWYFGFINKNKEKGYTGSYIAYNRLEEDKTNFEDYLDNIPEVVQNNR